jgi:hypothetical protein
MSALEVNSAMRDLSAWRQSSPHTPAWLSQLQTKCEEVAEEISPGQPPWIPVVSDSAVAAFPHGKFKNNFILHQQFDKTPDVRPVAVDEFLILILHVNALALRSGFDENSSGMLLDESVLQTFVWPMTQHAGLLLKINLFLLIHHSQKQVQVVWNRGHL